MYVFFHKSLSHFSAHSMKGRFQHFGLIFYLVRYIFGKYTIIISTFSSNFCSPNLKASRDIKVCFIGVSYYKNIDSTNRRIYGFLLYRISSQNNLYLLLKIISADRLFLDLKCVWVSFELFTKWKSYCQIIEILKSPKT